MMQKIVSCGSRFLVVVLFNVAAHNRSAWLTEVSWALQSRSVQAGHPPCNTAGILPYSFDAHVEASDDAHPAREAACEPAQLDPK